MPNAGQGRDKNWIQKPAQTRGNWISDVPSFTKAFLTSKGPLTPIQRVSMIGISLALAFCGVIACLDALDSLRSGGLSFSVTALPGLVLLAAGLIGLAKAIRAKGRSRQ
jgi:hypothetical protein